MNNTFVRGQGTFIARLTAIVHNLFFLLIVSSAIGLFTAILILWTVLPKAYWEGQNTVFRISKKIFRKRGILSFDEAIDYYLTRSFENYFLYESEFKIGLFWGILIAVSFFCLTGLFFIRRGKILESTKIVRGSELLSPSAYNRNYKSFLKEKGRLKLLRPLTYRLSRFKTLMGTPFVCGEDKLLIPEDSLYRHIAVLGATGVGKTTLIDSYLDYCRDGGEKVIIPDINGEYASRFYHSGDVVLSLSDANSHFWDFSSEPIPNEQFAEYLVPTGDEQNSFWWKGARAVLSQLLCRAKSGKELWNLINNQNEDLSHSLSGIARKISGSEGTGQSSGITGSTVLDLGFLEYLDPRPKRHNNSGGFSVYDWAQNRNSSWIFVTYSDSDKSIMGPICRIWINLAILGLFERKSIKVPPLNIVIDELNSVGQIELLPAAVERARKYRGKVVLGYQSDSQLRNVYGIQADSIKTNTSNKFIFRSPGTNDSRDLADFIGRSEVVQPNLSRSYGLLPKSERENIGEHKTLSSPVLDSEIRSLPDGFFYLRSCHMNPVKSQVLFKHRASSWYTPRFLKPKTKQKPDEPNSSDKLSSELSMVNPQKLTNDVKSLSLPQ